MSSTLLESDLDTQTITKAYARWAPVYDLVSARFSNAAATPRSRRLKESADASSRSASEPAFRCRIIPAT